MIHLFSLPFNYHIKHQRVYRRNSGWKPRRRGQGPPSPEESVPSPPSKCQERTGHPQAASALSYRLPLQQPTTSGCVSGGRRVCYTHTGVNFRGCSQAGKSCWPRVGPHPGTQPHSGHRPGPRCSRPRPLGPADRRARSRCSASAGPTGQ